MSEQAAVTGAMDVSEGACAIADKRLSELGGWGETGAVMIWELRHQLTAANESLHKCDGMANEINILTDEVRRLTAAYNCALKSNRASPSTPDAQRQTT